MPSSRIRPSQQNAKLCPVVVTAGCRGESKRRLLGQLSGSLDMNRNQLLTSLQTTKRDGLGFRHTRYAGACNCLLAVDSEAVKANNASIRLGLNIGGQRPNRFGTSNCRYIQALGQGNSIRSRDDSRGQGQSSTHAGQRCRCGSALRRWRYNCRGCEPRAMPPIPVEQQDSSLSHATQWALLSAFAIFAAGCGGPVEST